MRKYISLFLLLAILLTAIPLKAEAATYTVGQGQAYPSLLALFSANVLNANDTIILLGNDSSLSGRMIYLPNFYLTGNSAGPAIISQASPVSGTQPGGLLYINNMYATVNLQNINMANATVQGLNNTTSGGRGGALFGIYSLTIASISGANYFTGNSVVGGSAAASARITSSALGGAAMSANDLYVNVNAGSSLTFQENTARTGDLAAGATGDTTALGGALMGNVSMGINNNGDLYFTGNQVKSGNVVNGANNTRSAMGGAIFSGTVELDGSGNFYFSGNQATAGNADNASANLSGRGGAIYANDLYIKGSGSYLFSNNQARGGDPVNNGNSGNTALGGALSGNNIYLQGTASMAFNNNQVFDGNKSGAPGNSSYAARGGAIYANTLNITQQGAMSFTGNLAQGQKGSSTGLGGALAGSTINLGGGGGLVFDGNIAAGGTGNQSGLGGAIQGTTINISRNDELLFNGNLATAGSGAQGGHGGALSTTGAINLSGSGDITFSNNTAQGGSGNRTGMGGAIYVNKLQSTRAGNLTFSGNRANAGGGNNSGLGGAVFSSSALAMSGAFFSGNHAIGGGGSYSGLGGAIYGVNEISLNAASFADNRAQGGSGVASGQGGAVYAGNSLSIQNTSFTGNAAETGNSADLSSGLGGAVFMQAKDSTLTLDAAPGGNIVFSGNTHNPGNSGQVYNSIYFGNNYAAGTDYSATLNVNVEPGGLVRMLDPMAGQADNTADGNGDIRGNVTLDINKNGGGIWILAGRNYLPDGTEFNLDQGTLYLAESAAGPAVIDLASPNPAARESYFKARSATTLMLGPSYQTYQINAGQIELAGGSQVALDTRMRYRAPPVDEFIILKLRAQSSLQDGSSLSSGNGIMPIGFYNYDYTLGWRENNPLSKDLMLLLNNPTYVPSREARSAVNAPTVIAAFDQSGSLIFKRIMHNFAHNNYNEISDQQVLAMLGIGADNRFFNEDHPPLYANGMDMDDSRPHWLDFAGGGSLQKGNSSMWFLPAYSHTDNSGLNGYTLQTPTWMLGYDHWFNQRLFVGAAVAGSLPEYESADADIDAKNISGFLYAGALLPASLELGGFLSYGHTTYDQTRRTDNVSYNSDYTSNNFSAGLSLARNFPLSRELALRPFINYEYMHLKVGGNNEVLGEFSLDFDPHREDLHLLKAGLSLAYTFTSGSFIAGKLYYAGLYGDREPETQEFFTMDADHLTFISRGDALDKDSLGIGISAGVPLGSSLELSAGYNLLKGSNNTTHQANLGLVIKF